MQTETSLDRRISIFREYIKRYEEITHVLASLRQDKDISENMHSRFQENIDWCSKNYTSIKDAETQMEIIFPMTGVKSRHPVIWSLLSKFQSLETPTSDDIHDLKTGYLSLKATLGSLENKRDSIGEIKIEEYEKLKSLIERYTIESSSIDSILKLADDCEFLGLDFNWMLSTIALQLQEVAITLVATKLGIRLDQSHVSEILGKPIEKELSFKNRYLAFCSEIKRIKNVTLSILPSDFREIRRRVLHEGKPPQASEAKLLIEFTRSFLKDLHQVTQ